MNPSAQLSRLPKMDLVLGATALADTTWRRDIVKRVVGDALAQLRASLLRGDDVPVPSAEGLAEQTRATLERWAVPGPRRVLNATGVLLHTNIGRAPLSDAAIAAMAEAARTCDLEIGLADGQRGSRFSRIRPLLAAAVGAEDAHVVNNNAAALLLACTVLGGQGGVALSAGQMVEIGDGFRVATMAAAGGCRVVGVGSTNRTHLADYEAALEGHGCPGGPVEALLWCHLSNFSQSGFVKEVSLPELAALARSHEVPLIADLGSGSLGGGLPPSEPTIARYLDEGADLVLVSGDKLLGGPQAGIVAGRADLVERCRRFPMARALRPDKTSLAALHATLVAHATAAIPALPLHAMVTTDVARLRARAEAIATELGWGAEAIVDSVATIGGGSLPGDTLPSVALRVPGEHASRRAKALRLGALPVFGRIEDGGLHLDLRSLDPRDDAALVEAVRATSER
jgi:L-seryl-tRNA(Ser) seleniumtransferase